jgi:hypothetical protein
VTSDTTQHRSIADHQVCVIFDRRTGKIAHVHECLTLEGAPARSRHDVEARAMELAREFAAQLPGIELEQLELLYVRGEELPDGPVTQVDLEARRIVSEPAVQRSLD